MGGEGFITYSTYRLYAQDNGIEGEDFDLFLTFMGMIDGEWIRMQSEKAKEAK